MTCNEYLEVLWQEDTFHTLISELYWSGGVNTDKMFNFMLDHAAAHSITLVDAHHWDYDKPMFLCYNNSDDKALS